MSKDIRIVAVQTGYVAVGEYTHDTNNGVVRIKAARIIRRFGTQYGLPQLAVEGKSDATELEDAGTIEVPWHSVVIIFQCIHPSWFA